MGTAWDQSPEALAKTAQPLVAPVGKLKGPIDEYEEVPGAPTWPAVEETMTILPHRRRTISPDASRD